MTKRFEEDKVYKRDVDPVILDKVVERYDDYIVVVSKYEDQDEWETNEHIWAITEDPIRGAEIVTIHNGKEIVLDSRDEVQIEDEKLARNRADTCVIKFDDWVRGKEYDAVCLTTNQTFKVEFFKFIRAEKKFPDLDSLKAQIAIDCKKAEEFFRRRD